jgi:succinoglycan biosynthesis protein ExoA
VNDELPTATIIIPARPGQSEIKAVTGSRALDYPPEKLEILVARGRQPSIQRNTALKAARGDLIYFLDDDSVPQPQNLREAARQFADPKVKMLGGPNLCPPEAPPLEKAFALVLGSWLAFGPSRARYAAVGTARETSEKELILCNLVARREAIVELGGFNEKLYPNEENALMDELQKRGGRLLYDPKFIVHRRPRATLGSFIKMLRTYGRGRAEQFREHPTFGSALNFVPPLFCVYLVLLAFWFGLSWPYRMFALLPLVVYGLVVLAQAALLVRVGGVARSLAAIPLIVLTHLLYGLGFWHGLTTSLRRDERRPPVEVELETVTP